MTTITDKAPKSADAQEGRESMERFFGAVERLDMATLGRLVTDDVVMEWPQSGERFRGRDNALAALEAQDDMPEMAAPPRIVGHGDVWAAMVPLRYGDEVYQYVGIFELRDGLVARSTEYFGAPFPAKEARARFTEAG